MTWGKENCFTRQNKHVALEWRPGTRIDEVRQMDNKTANFDEAMLVGQTMLRACQRALCENTEVSEDFCELGAKAST